MPRFVAIMFLWLVSYPTWSQIPEGTLFRRVSRASNFEFAIYNNGMLYGDFSYEPGGESGLFGPYLSQWPRGSFHLFGSSNSGQGIMILAKKEGKTLESDAGFMRPAASTHGPFDNMVPGRVGDPKAGYDSLSQGAGWLYVDDRDYIVYSGLDYDSNGVDVSGNNYHDWPIRLVDGKCSYVPDPLERDSYPPVFRSDEDMFCVFKDTDRRGDRENAAPNEPQTPNPNGPIGIEIRNTIHSWSDGPAKDIVLLDYEILNRSGTMLDSCYVVFGAGISLATPSLNLLRRSIFRYTGRDLAYVRPTDPEQWGAWTATAIPPTIGYPVLEAPVGEDGRPLGLTRVISWDTVSSYLDSVGNAAPLQWTGDDSIIYRTMTDPPPWLQPYPPTSPTLFGPLLLSGPYEMQENDTVEFTVGIIFSDSLEHLLLLDDFITRVYNNNFQRPSPPPASHLTATGLNRAIKLSWDNSAESATDIIIPDSLGRPFMGYRLLRATTKAGPYVELGKWTVDSSLVYEYLDRGEDLVGGLKNNVTYYYRLLSFDEGAVKLKLDPMESPPVDGVNAVGVIPSTEPPDVEGEEVTQEMMDGIRVVPNPYLIRHEAQTTSRAIYFNYLPTECTIRIYTIAMDLVKTIHHSGGSREEWDLTTEGGQLVASQMFVAHVESTNGLETIKKFSVVVGK